MSPACSAPPSTDAVTGRWIRPHRATPIGGPPDHIVTELVVVDVTPDGPVPHETVLVVASGRHAGPARPRATARDT